jgi:XTP/dITP diphosphohydrolase
MIQKIVLATNNRHKISEIQAITPSSLQWISLSEANILNELPETSATIEGNSMQKAAYAFSRTQLPTLAEDTGLEVEALDGAPGVYSARYAGENATSEENIEKLLFALDKIKNRKARFKTVITFQTFEKVIQFEGIIAGEITEIRKGGNGFGYDSVFIPAGFNHTFAEMEPAQKRELSHRQRAFVKFLSYLSQSIDN